MNTEHNPPSRASFNPWPISIIAFFTVAVFGCGAFVAFCSRHPADLVSADYYEQEIRYQSQIDGRQHAQERARSATVIYDSKTRLISICLPAVDSSSQVVGKVQLYRPSAMDLDREFPLVPKAGGVQEIDASTMLPGLWKVRVSWTVGAQDYFVDQKLVIGSAS